MQHSFRTIEPPEGTAAQDWHDWKWQHRSALKTQQQFANWFELSREELLGFESLQNKFKSQTTPYYASLADASNPLDPIRRIFMPHQNESQSQYQEMLDPLGEKKNNPAPRIIHRYPDRLLFMPTDICSVYCRYCTRKHFTAKDQAFASKSDYEQAMDYIKSRKEVREVILSGGDPLTLSDHQLLRVVTDLRGIEHIEIIRIGTRMPVVNPMRITDELVTALKTFHPIYVMVHFNHPDELTTDSASALTRLVDHGFPVFNQMVFLNGINNHPAIVQALSRRLLKLRVKPYYMFQCDPSEGTDHLRTSLEQSQRIQANLWGRLSGLAMPNLSLDIPNGGGKVGFVPDYTTAKSGNKTSFRGWDGVESDYVSPPMAEALMPEISPIYIDEWNQLNSGKSRS